jgi:hypothetical protein
VSDITLIMIGNKIFILYYKMINLLINFADRKWENIYNAW